MDKNSSINQDDSLKRCMTQEQLLEGLARVFLPSKPILKIHKNSPDQRTTTTYRYHFIPKTEKKTVRKLNSSR
jgi:hypothetical protein